MARRRHAPRRTWRIPSKPSQPSPSKTWSIISGRRLTGCLSCASVRPASSSSTRRLNCRNARRVGKESTSLRARRTALIARFSPPPLPPGVYCLCASFTLTCCLPLAQDGADCPDGAEFKPKVVGSVWMAETDASGVKTNRISSCPAGHALVRTMNIALADKCERCPGTQLHGYNIGGAQWIAPGPMGLNDFCKECPLPKGT